MVKLWPLGLKFPVNNRASLTDQIENQTFFFFAIMRWFLSQVICMWLDLSSLTKLINKFDVTKLISTECKFCCYSLWITKVWWMSGSLSSCMKNLKFWVRYIHCKPSKVCQVSYGFAHGFTKFVYTWFWEANSADKSNNSYCTLG